LAPSDVVTRLLLRGCSSWVAVSAMRRYDTVAKSVACGAGAQGGRHTLKFSEPGVDALAACLGHASHCDAAKCTLRWKSAMLELGIGAVIVRGLGWVLWVGLFGAILMAIRIGKTWKQRFSLAGLVLAAVITSLLPKIYRDWEQKKRYEAAKAVFDERCKTAGAKIYRTVNGVEGVLLLDIPPKASDADRFDPNWPQAGFPQQYGGESYVANFLRWESVQGQPRGALNNVPFSKKDHPGYRFVDVKDADGATWRYLLGSLEEQGSGLLRKERVSESISRYSVSLIYLASEEDRKNWVAGVTVVLNDVQTGSTLAQGTWYSFEPGLGSRAGHRTPWLFAISCPELRGGAGTCPSSLFCRSSIKANQGGLKCQMK